MSTLDAVPGIDRDRRGARVATLAIGTCGLRISRTTSDFFVASRTVRPRLNASAIGGEYLSAASFLGVAGLVLTFGADMLWYPVGWTAGYLVLLVLVAAPLRRSGRLHAARLRRGPAGLAPGPRGLLGARGGDRLALPAAAVPGRRPHAALRGRRAGLGRAGAGRRGRAGQRHLRRDAQHHLRPGLPVLAQAHRAAGAARGAAGGLARRRGGHPRRRPGSSGRRPGLVDAARRRRRRARASTRRTR